MKIKYQFVTGETKEVEVEAGLYNEMHEITKQMNTINKREQRKKTSIDTAIEEGRIEYEDENENFVKRKTREQQLELLPLFIDLLNNQQKDLVNRVFFLRQSLTQIAQELGVSVVAIHKQKKTILKKLKTFFEKQG